MPTPTNFLDDTPSIDGPDYVALVIEWDELADNLERETIERTLLAKEPQQVRRRSVAPIAIAAGALGVLALAWGIVHRLRA